METFVVPADRAGLELDEFLCLQYPGVSKGALRGEVRAGRVTVDGVRAQPSARLRDGHVVICSFDEETLPVAPAAPAVRLDVLYEDDALLVVDKPAGLAVETERWAPELPTVAGGLQQLAEARRAGWRPRLVHRLDKDTTGAICAAKTLAAERALRRAFEVGEVDKSYLALVEGEHPLAEGEEETIDRPLAPDARRSGRMRVEEGGKESRTRIAVEERFDGYTLMRCAPETGRTHQIRVHLADAGFPLVIDPLYGRRDAWRLSEFKAGYRAKRGSQERPLMSRLTLHAERLTLPSVPVDELPPERAESARRAGGGLTVEAPIPKDFARVLKQLRKNRPFANPHRGGDSPRRGDRRR